MRTTSLLPFLSLGLLGCLGTEPQVDERLAAGGLGDPFDVAGEEGQGVDLQGDVLGLTGVRVTGAKDASGAPLVNVHIDKGEIVAGKLIFLPGDLRPRRITVRGLDLKGATFIAEKGNTKSTWTIRVDEVVPNPIWAITEAAFDPTGKTFFYQFSYLQLGVPPDTKDEWIGLCKPNRLGETWAVPVGAVWGLSGERIETPSLFTLGCLSGVIAKCEGWGYQPWQESHGNIDMKYAHQTCTRMARADYCGNGVAHTYNDTHINVYDLLSPTIRIDDQNEGAPHQMLFESAWRSDGAVCLAKARWDNLPPPSHLCGDHTAGPFYRSNDDDDVSPPSRPSICDSLSDVLDPHKPWANYDPAILVTESYIQRYPRRLVLPPFPIDRVDTLSTY